MTRLKQIRDLKRPPAKTPPTRSGSTINAITSGTSINVQIPVGAQTGDLGFLAITVAAAATVATPAGLTLLPGFPVTPDASGAKLYVWIGTVQAGSQGNNVVFTQSASGAAVSGCITYGAVGGYSVAPQTWLSTNVEVLNGRPIRFPSAKAGPQDVMLGIASTSSYVSTNLNASQVTTAPTGMTIRQATTAQDSILTLARGLAFMDGPGHALQVETFATTTNSHAAAVMITLSPLNPRWSEIERKPPSLGSLVHIYGSSSSAYVKKPEANSGYNTRMPWGKRLQAAFGSNPSSTNYSLPGARAADICTYMYGTASRATEAVAGDDLAVNRAGTYNPAQALAVGALDCVGNDIIALGGSAQALKGAENATDAMVRLLRAASAYAHNDAAVTKVGTWTTQTSNGLMFGVTAQTTVPGSTWTLQVTDKPAIDLILIGGDNASVGNAGASFRVLLDGVQIATGTTHNQMKATAPGTAYTDYKFCQMAVPVTGIPAGTHTITVEHTGTSGAILQVNGALVPKATPPWVSLNCLHRNTTAETTYGYTWTTQQAYHQVLRDVAARFTDGRVVVYDPNASGRWDQTTMVASDYVHQDEKGHALYAWELMRLYSERIP